MYELSSKFNLVCSFLPILLVFISDMCVCVPNVHKEFSGGYWISDTFVVVYITYYNFSISSCFPGHCMPEYEENYLKKIMVKIILFGRPRVHWLENCYVLSQIH